MSFSRMLEYLQIKNKGKIVFVNAGNFYIAMGKDAVLLNKLLGLKTSCMKTEICKVGFPITALEKYSIGTEYKSSMYKTIEDILIISKLNNNEVLFYLNKIDARLNVQRIYLRIMKKEK